MNRARRDRNDPAREWENMILLLLGWLIGRRKREGATAAQIKNTVASDQFTKSQKG